MKNVKRRTVERLLLPKALLTAIARSLACIRTLDKTYMSRLEAQIRAELEQNTKKNK